MPATAAGATGSATLTLAPRTDSIAAARRLVTSFLRSHAPSGIDVASAELVVSELATNAVEHGQGGEVVVAVAYDGGELSIAVTAEGDGVAEPTEWNLAGPDALVGRGLGIVKALASAVEVGRTSTHTTVTASFSGR